MSLEVADSFFQEKVTCIDLTTADEEAPDDDADIIFVHQVFHKRSLFAVGD